MNIRWVQYLIAGKEEAPETGTKHLQGYIYLNKRKRMNTLKNMFGCNEIHFEIAKGTIKQNVDYCSKTDPNPFIWGEYPGDNANTSEAQWKEYIQACLTKTREEMVDDPKWSRTFITNPKTYDTIRDAKIRRETRNGERQFNEWYWGEAGTGKSRKAREENPGAYIKLCNKWWDGYDGEKVVIMEDLDPGTGRCLTHHMKIWGDRYPMRIECKGSSQFINPVKMIITSNYSPDQIWAEQPEDLKAIRERYKVTQFNKL